MAKRNRTPKKGFVYLLRSSIRGDHYKFGCTSLTPAKRCKKINSETGLDFYVVCSFKSFDMYEDEKLIKWRLLPDGLGFLGEFFDLDGISTENELIKRFLTIGGVLEGECLHL